MMRARASRNILAVAHGVALHIDLMHMVERIHHGQVDMLTDTGLLTVIQGIPQGSKSMDATADVCHSEPDKLRRSIRRTGHVHKAGKRLGNKIVSHFM